MTNKAPNYYQEWIQACKAVKVKGALPVQFRAEKQNGDLFIVATATVPHVHSPTNRTTHVHTQMCMEPHIRPTIHIFEELIYQLYTHEASENFMVGDKYVRDPHHINGPYALPGQDEVRPMADLGGDRWWDA